MAKTIPDGREENQGMRRLVDLAGSQYLLRDIVRQLRPDLTIHQSYVNDWLRNNRSIGAQHFEALMAAGREMGIKSIPDRIELFAGLKPEIYEVIAPLLKPHDNMNNLA